VHRLLLDRARTENEDKRVSAQQASQLPGGKFSTDINAHLQMTDNEVMCALLEASRNSGISEHDAAKRIVSREHFRVLYERNPTDVERNSEAGKQIFEAAIARFGKENVRRDSYTQRSGAFDFPVHLKDHRTASSLLISETLRKIPVVAVDYVYIIPEKRDEALKWLEENRTKLLERKEKET